MKFRPLQDRILVKIKPENEGVVVRITPNAGERFRGEVVAVGDGSRFPNGELVPVRVRKGDIILFDGGADIKIEGESLMLLRESDVIGICGNVYEGRLARAVRTN